MKLKDLIPLKEQRDSVSPLILKKVNVLVDGEKTDVSIRYNPYKDLQDVIISWGEESHTVDFDAEDVIDDHGNEGKDMSFVAFSENDKWRFIVDVSVEYNYENSGNIQEIMWDSLEIDIDDLKKENKMKKSQLRNIIRESIKELMNEQYMVQGPNTDPPYNWSTIQDAYTAVQNQNWHFVNSNDPTQGNVTINYSVCVDQAIDGGYLDASAQTGGGVFGLVCSGIGTSASDLNFFNSPFQLNINTPPTGMSLMDAANDPNSGFYDQSGCNAACNQYQQSQLIPGCMYPNACNYDPAATQNDGSCTWGPAGPTQPCPSTPAVIEGCMDPLASNYDATANEDDGSCMYPAGSGTTATLDRGPRTATPDRTKNDPNVTQDNPQVRRMRELANIKK